MSQVYLHIGFHKTGSSAVQEWFYENRGELAKDGVLYPKPLSSFPAHQELAWALYADTPKWADRKYDAQEVYAHFAQLVAEATPDSVVLLSSEDLCGLDADPTAIQFVARHFAKHDLRVIAYLRPPLEFIASLYSHEVRMGIPTPTFKEFVMDAQVLRRADYARRLLPWRDVFGAERLILRRYGRQYWRSLLDDFLDALGVSTRVSKPLKRVNVGVHPWLVNAHRLLNHCDSTDEEKQAARELLRRASLRLPPVSATEFLLDGETLEELSQRLEPCLRRLADQFGVEF
jgi:hypothetical protein